MTILILDQFAEPSPYQLQRHPIRFDLLVASKLTAADPQDWRRPRLAEVPDDQADAYVPEWSTTVIRAGVDGMASVWRCRWDTSG